MTETKREYTFADFMDGDKDLGKEPPSKELSEQDRELVTVYMATQAAYTQLVLEGIIPAGEELHYQIHFQEFVHKLKNGGEIVLPRVAQTVKVDSAAGELYVKAIREAFKRGDEIARNVRDVTKKAFEEYQKLQQAQNSDEQTNKDESIDPDLSPKRTLN